MQMYVVLFNYAYLVKKKLYFPFFNDDYSRKINIGILLKTKV